MQTLVDLPEEDLQLLDEISAEQGISREELVKRAVAVALERRRAALKPRNDEALRAGFGLWKDMEEDGLAYQERLREEWAEREREQYSIRTS